MFLPSFRFAFGALPPILYRELTNKLALALGITPARLLATGANDLAWRHVPPCGLGFFMLINHSGGLSVSSPADSTSLTKCGECLLACSQPNALRPRFPHQLQFQANFPFSAFAFSFPFCLSSLAFALHKCLELTRPKPRPFPCQF